MKSKIWQHILFNLLLLITSKISFAQMDTSTSKIEKDSSLKTVEVNIEINYLRHYLWRGALFGNDDVSQPVIETVYKNFKLILSANLNYFPKNLPKATYSKQVMYDEQDIELCYNNKIKNFSYEVKADAYIYFNQIGANPTVEACVKFAYPINKKKTINIITETVVDIANYNSAFYNNIGLQWQKEEGTKNDVNIQIGASFGNSTFSEAYYYSNTSGLLYIGGRISLLHHFKKFDIGLATEYNAYCNNEIKLATGLNETTNFSLSVRKGFAIRLMQKRKTNIKTML